MSQDIPVTGYAILGLLTFGDELTGYEVKQRADFTLRFYWVSPAMSQIYTELRRLTEHGLVTADARADGGREVTTYAITAAGQAALREWMDTTPAGFPVLKHTVLLRLLVGHVTEPEQTRRMLLDYVAELDQALTDLAGVREGLRGSDPRTAVARRLPGRGRWSPAAATPSRWGRSRRTGPWRWPRRAGPRGCR